jgi:phosphoribosylformylglycinamidine cyclo-ligase
MEKLDYTKAGVDIEKALNLVERIKPLARQTHRPGVASDLGGFGALFSIDKDAYREPVLVSSTDGVGTKLKVAFMANRHNTVGVDLVAMCANDVAVQGAEPLFFLDYLAFGRLNPDVAVELIRGISQGCREAGCALIGGETAELPDMYRPDEYDMAGFCVGIVERQSIIDGSSITRGDQIIGLASNGLHSNGYSLVRKIFFERLRWKIDRYVPQLGCALADELLRPTRIYVPAILNLLKDIPIKGLVHVTGGGITENLPRILPQNCRAVVHTASWSPPAIFRLIQEAGKVDFSEMMRVFNNGIGLLIIVSPKDAQEVISRSRDLQETPHMIGEIEERAHGQPPVEYVA